MHDAILRAALTLAAAWGADGAPALDAPELQSIVRVMPLSAAMRRADGLTPAPVFTMRDIEAPPCLDIGIVHALPNAASDMTVLGEQSGAAETWRDQVARCKGGVGDLRLAMKK